MSIKRQRLLVYLVMGVSLVTATKLVKDIFRVNRADERIAQAEAELNEAKKEKEKLTGQLEETDSGVWRESQIRNVLKMAKEGEVVVVVPDEIVLTATQAAAAKLNQDKPTGNFQKWLQVFGLYR